MGIEMAATDALAIEADVFQLASEHSYRNSSMSAAVGVTKRNKDEFIRVVDEANAALQECGRNQAQKLLQCCTETGSNNEVTAKRQGVEKRKLGRLTRERIVKAGFLCPKGDLQVLGYLTEIPTSWGPGGEAVDGAGEKQTCARCGPHVFKEEADEALHKRAPYTTFAQLAKDVGVEHSALEIAALDCEMSYTTAGLSVTRITLVDEMGEVVFDELIRCSGDVRVLDFNTQFSGIQPKEYEENAVLDLHAARRALVQYIGPNTILIGHGLENDLRAIRVVHTNIVDTCQLFPHPRGLPFRLALRDLVATHLGKIIQAGGSAVGHSSAEDAQTTLELVRYKWTQLCT
ncbi:RNA exonuclease 3 [Malassezia brasiliensis]|uniref:RNA exonuclease 3 n=1 Tax=Malassezia brasiliensis TaxID=1821822 RepID=A0AAF0DWJ7_9BASI|nr:RNA exonuclease 3 [Malassezia brasiliensis]